MLFGAQTLKKNQFFFDPLPRNNINKFLRKQNERKKPHTEKRKRTDHKIVKTENRIYWFSYKKKNNNIYIGSSNISFFIERIE